jgi:small multidrug resistance pump
MNLLLLPNLPCALRSFRDGLCAPNEDRDRPSVTRDGAGRALVNWVYLGAAILAEVAGTTALKATEGFTKIGPSLIVVLGYGAAFFLLSLTLRTIPVGIAYAIWSGLGIVLISITGWFFYKQALDGPAMIGIALIIAGVIVLNLSSSVAGH